MGKEASAISSTEFRTNALRDVCKQLDFCMFDLFQFSTKLWTRSETKRVLDTKAFVTLCWISIGISFPLIFFGPYFLAQQVGRFEGNAQDFRPSFLFTKFGIGVQLVLSFGCALITWRRSEKLREHKLQRNIEQEALLALQRNIITTKEILCSPSSTPQQIANAGDSFVSSAASSLQLI